MGGFVGIDWPIDGPDSILSEIIGLGHDALRPYLIYSCKLTPHGTSRLCKTAHFRSGHELPIGLSRVRRGKKVIRAASIKPR